MNKTTLILTEQFRPGHPPDFDALQRAVTLWLTNEQLRPGGGVTNPMRDLYEIE